MDVTSYLSSAGAANSSRDSGEFASLGDFDLATAMQQINEAIEEEEDLKCLIERVGKSLLEVMMTREPSAQGSIWLTEHPPEDSDGRIVPFLKCWHIFGENRWPDNRIRRFGAGSVDGVIGWVAHHRQAINRRVHDPDEDPLPDGKRVVDQYLSRVKPDHVGAELAVPMLFRDRLVGVLNLERPEAERFLRDSELIAQMVALHLAQAIHQRRVDQLFSWILGESEIKRLAETVVTEGAKILEAPFAGLFLWDVPTQTLRLAASTAKIIDEERVLTSGEVCFPVPGVGLVRWTFDQRMWLNVRDTEIYLDGGSVELHDQSMREIQSQIVDQRFGGSLNYEVKDQGEDTNNKQRFWQFTAAGKTVTVPQPIWKRDCQFRAGHARSIVTVPLMDHRPGPAYSDARPTASATSRPALRRSPVLAARAESLLRR